MLCTLLAKFTFAPTGKKIYWNQSNVRYPSVEDGVKPSLPMLVAVYKVKGSQ